MLSLVRNMITNSDSSGCVASRMSRFKYCRAIVCFLNFSVDLIPFNGPWCNVYIFAYILIFSLSLFPPHLSLIHTNTKDVNKHMSDPVTEMVWLGREFFSELLTEQKSLSGNVSQIGKFKRVPQRPTQEDPNVNKIDSCLATSLIE